VRRLLQLGTFLLISATLFTPIVEFFDQWDPPGPEDDTEMAVFGFIFVMCLVLLVCKLTASIASFLSLVVVAALRQNKGSPVQAIRYFVSVVPPQISPPLRT
jgi:Na+/phosphate symporter